MQTTARIPVRPAKYEKLLPAFPAAQSKSTRIGHGVGSAQWWIGPVRMAMHVASLGSVLSCHKVRPRCQVGAMVDWPVRMIMHAANLGSVLSCRRCAEPDMVTTPRSV
jgi:hypothetical protein